jgi:hypothetical protein
MTTVPHETADRFRPYGQEPPTLETRTWNDERAQT